MRSLLVCLTASSLSLLALACNSSSQSGTPPQPQATSASANVTGPFGALDAKTAKQEQWKIENANVAFLFFDAQNLKLSASCQKPDGSLDCDAFRFFKNGQSVTIPRRELDGRMSAGTKMCRKLGYPTLNGQNSLGSEDGFCKFPDGSMTTTGALEQHGLKTVE